MTSKLAHRSFARCLATALLALALAGCWAPLSSAKWGNRLRAAEIRRVAVLPFETFGESPGPSDVVTDLFTTSLYSTQRFHVMEKNEAVRKLSKGGLTLSAAVDRETAKKAGRILGVEGVFVGTITEYTYLMYPEDAVVGLSVSLIDTETGDTVWSGLFNDRARSLIQGGDASITTLARGGVEQLVSSFTAAPNGAVTGLGQPAAGQEAQ